MSYHDEVMKLRAAEYVADLARLGPELRARLQSSAEQAADPLDEFVERSSAYAEGLTAVAHTGKAQVTPDQSLPAAVASPPPCEFTSDVNGKWLDGMEMTPEDAEAKMRQGGTFFAPRQSPRKALRTSSRE